MDYYDDIPASTDTSIMILKNGESTYIYELLCWLHSKIYWVTQSWDEKSSKVILNRTFYTLAFVLLEHFNKHLNNEF